jgi:hypothetical protein
MRTASAAAVESRGISPVCWVDATKTTVAERNGSFLFGQRAAFAAQTSVNRRQSDAITAMESKRIGLYGAESVDWSNSLRREALYPALGG